MYPREAEVIPGDLLSLPTVLTLTSSLPRWGAKQGWEWAWWGDLGRDRAQAPPACWLCLALGSLGWQGQNLGQGQAGSVGSLPNPSRSQPGPSTAKLGQLCKSPAKWGAEGDPHPSQLSQLNLPYLGARCHSTQERGWPRDGHPKG